MKEKRPNLDQVQRVISECFSVEEHELRLSGIPVSNLVEEFGSPLFVYDAGVVAQKVNQIRSVLPSRFELYYSIKANPNASILKCLLQSGCGLEVASGGELFQALDAGCKANQIIFAGPGKTQGELASALDAGIGEIHVEAIEEARMINRLAGERRQVATVAIRVNPIDTSGGAMRMGGKASPFGVDEEQLEVVVKEMVGMDHLEIQGVHLYMGTQILDSNVLVDQYRKAVSIAKRVAEHVGKPLRTIDFGGGWGTPYFAHETRLDLKAVALGLAEIDAMIQSEPLLSSATGILEPGRFLVNEAGVYISTVTRVKESRGKTFAVIDGGMHHHLAASGNLGQAIKRNYPVAILNKLGMPVEKAIEVVGPLCTPLDTLGRSVKLPTVEANDLMGVFMSGAYARSSSPLGFLSHNSPAEVMVEDGKARLIRQRGQASDYLRDQV